MVRRFRKKPVVVEAIRWTGKNGADVADFLGTVPPALRDRFPLHPRIGIATLEGTMVAEPGDWIIRGVKGELYPCKPDIFEATYEEVVTS
jgi:hypothetical protein